MEKVKVVVLGHVAGLIGEGYYFEMHWGLKKIDGTYIRKRFWGAIQSTDKKWVASHWNSEKQAASWAKDHGFLVELTSKPD